MLRSFTLGFAALSCSVFAIGVASSTGCFVTPPPELSQPALTAPRILDDAVYPPLGEILATLPTQFIVPVEIDSADESFVWEVYVDYDPCAGGSCLGSQAPQVGPTQQTASPATADGGVTIANFPPPSQLDPTTCHRIDFLVAVAFDPGSQHTWDSRGGDIVTWFYNAGGGTNGCPEYDAGALEDGASTQREAGTDALEVVPTSDAGDR
jgi:hypothetical protein